MIRYKDELIHTGVGKLDGAPGRGSGRWELGSGENPYQREISFMNSVRQYQEEGLNYTEIARAMGMSTKEFRERLTVDGARVKQLNIQTARRLKADHWSDAAIADYLGVSPRTVGNYLKVEADNKKKAIDNTAEVIKAAADKNRFIDVGLGANLMIGEGVTKEKFNSAIRSLTDKGYNLYEFQVPQLASGYSTQMKVLGVPGTTYKECLAERDKIGFITDFMLKDNGKTIKGIEPPASISSKRVYIKYAEDGGKSKDGVIEIRRNVPDLSLGSALYAQARIAVDDSYYLKGMAIYSDNIPDGYDIVFNTNKTKNVPMMGPSKDNSVLKPMKKSKETGEIDWTNPFGTTLRMSDGQIVGQSHYIDKDGKEKLGAINIVRQEGDWDVWSKTLSTQFLAKQPIPLIIERLNATYDDKIKEFNDYKSIQNPELRQSLIAAFADDCDASAAHLKAKSLPGQTTKVLLPLSSIGEKEAFLPTYEDGDQVILIRYPHGGTFEIPLLTVNNKNQEGISTIGLDAKDAIGIHPNTASQLSGADYDGDTATVIPVKGITFQADSPLKQLKDFDPAIYTITEKDNNGETIKVKINTQKEMGMISNLITDMNTIGAEEDEYARAVRHSMVVIDAEKHNYDYKRSFIENNIAGLKEKYQGDARKGASTLISRANAEARTEEIKEKTSTKQRTDEEQAWFDSVKDNYKSLSGEDRTKFYKIRNKLDADEYQRYLNGEKIYYKTGEGHVSNFRRAKEQDWLDKYKGAYESLDKKEKEKYIKIEKKMTPDEYNAYQKGEKIFVTLSNGKTFEKTPKIEKNLTKDHGMNLVRDAHELSTGSAKEEIYADYANKLKALANEARKESRNVEMSKVNKESKNVYAKEIASLNEKIKIAQLNAPLERKANIIASVEFKNIRKSNPDLSDDEEGKIKTQLLAGARYRVGANKRGAQIQLTGPEWNAIQAGALSSSRIKDVIKYTDKDKILSYALPRDSKDISKEDEALINRMASEKKNSIADIAKATGFSKTVVAKTIRKEEE